MSVRTSGVSIKTWDRPSTENGGNALERDENTQKKWWKCTKYCGCFDTRYDSVFCCFSFLMIFSLLLAVIIPLVINKVIDDSVTTQVVIDSEDAPNYLTWKTNANGQAAHDILVTYDLYYFECQNVHDFLNNGEKPIMAELGPYSFKEYFNKFDIVWTDDGDTVTYNTQRYYTFDPVRSGPGLAVTDNITLPFSTVVGFQYILSKIPSNVTDTITQTLEEKIASASAVLEIALRALPAKVTQAWIQGKITKKQRDSINAQIGNMLVQVTVLSQNLEDFVAASNSIDLLLKTILCSVPSGVSPFWVSNPLNGWFGWLNDPILSEVGLLLKGVEAQTGKVVPFTSAVAGSVFNFTSIEETRRRKQPDTLKTGKKNQNQIAQYVKFNNMTTFYMCVNPMASQNTSDYTEGVQFPACELFQTEWNQTYAKTKGYGLTFATPYANRIAGTDGNMAGRPLLADQVQVFTADIYRSAYSVFYGTVSDWHGIPLRRYSIQHRDLLNATYNPDNAQFYNFAPTGLENVTAAVIAPVFLSMPHFLMCDPSLISEIKGMKPNPEVHLAYEDIEPQTGLLVRARKRIQVNYHFMPQFLPTLPAPVVQLTDALCSNYSTILSELQAADVATNLTVPMCDRNSTGILQCLTIPSTWNIRNGAGTYLPAVWLEEALTQHDGQADQLQTQLFAMEQLAVKFQLWTLIIGGGCFAVLLAMAGTRHLLTPFNNNVFDANDSFYHPVHVPGPSSPLLKEDVMCDEDRLSLGSSNHDGLPQ